METQTISQSKTVKVNWTIPVRSIYSILVLMFLIPFGIVNFVYLIKPGFQDFLGSSHSEITLEDIGYVWLPIITYILVTSTICFIVRIFNPLKSYTQRGLIWKSVNVFTVALVFGLIGAFAGLLFYNITGEIIGGFIGGFALGIVIEISR